MREKNYNETNRKPKSERMWNTLAYLLGSPYNQLLNHRLKEIVSYYCFKVMFEYHT